VARFMRGRAGRSPGVLNCFARDAPGKPHVLLYYRVAAFLLSASVATNQLLKQGLVVLRYYTVW
jgi:hypothetical protein